eukprot:gnl/Trimastix_PCT/5192.p1 GENE.gnl/Trimastix_PCT/5192~~gnl/Trimastix_PCT/5192.p1  ORF type:complete len:355 (-),score=58.73 gnl/Trimastix_PCT/5192:123-1037(-)
MQEEILPRESKREKSSTRDSTRFETLEIPSRYDLIDPFKRSLYRSFWLLYSVICPFILSKSFAVFRCHKRCNGRSYMLHESDLPCSGVYWMTLAICAGVQVFVYGVVIPCFVLGRLYVIKQNHHDEQVREQWGFLYYMYRSKCWYWPVLDIVHKLGLSGLLLFFNGFLQISMALVFQIAYSMLSIRFRPFKSPFAQSLHILLEVHLTILLFGGIAIAGIRDQSVIGILLYGSTFLMVLVLGFSLLRHVLRLNARCRRCFKRRIMKENYVIDDLFFEAGKKKKKNRKTKKSGTEEKERNESGVRS